MENLSGNQPLVTVLVAIISSITTIAVARISNKVGKQIQTRTPTTTAGYERVFNYLQAELEETRDKLDKTQALLNQTKESLRRERERVKKVEELSDKRRMKLLEVSREFKVDVSNLV